MKEKNKTSKTGLEKELVDARKLIKNLEEQLNSFKGTTEAIINATNDIILILDKNGIVLKLNKSAAERLKKPAQKIIGKHILNQITSGTIKTEKARIFKSIANKKEIRFENIENGFIYDTQVTPVLDKMGEIKYMIVFSRDITEYLQLERIIVGIRENERREIGMELHDNLSHYLLGIAIKSKLLAKSVAKFSAGDARRVVEIEKQINKAIKETQNIAKGIFPIDLENKSLIEMIKKISNDIEKKYRLPVTLEIEDSIEIDDTLVATNLYYIIQEAVKNAVKYARAKKITINLTKNKKEVILKIRDNGIGLLHKMNGSTGIGINIMKYRAKMIGGSLTIKSKKSAGTEITCRCWIE